MSTPLISTMTNVGNSPLRFGSVTVTGDFRMTKTCRAVLPIGQQCTFSIVFAPTQSGTRIGAITIKTNASTVPQTLQLTGNGTP